MKCIIIPSFYVYPLIWHSTVLELKVGYRRPQGKCINKKKKLVTKIFYLKLVNPQNYYTVGFEFSLRIIIMLPTPHTDFSLENVDNKWVACHSDYYYTRFSK